MSTFVFKLPDVGEGTAEAEIVAWYASIGEHVAEDQHLVDVMTDKATVEITAPVAGTVTALHAQPGDRATVGAPLVEFEVDDMPAAKEPEPAAAAPVAVPVRAAQTPVAETAKILAAPAVRLRAADLGIALEALRGTGPGGRVTHGDLDDFLRAGGTRSSTVPAAAPSRRDAVTEIPVRGLRRRIAERMAEANRRVPHITYVEEIDMTELEALRAELNAAHAAKRGKLTVLPFLIRALVRGLPEWPQINAHFDDEANIVRRYSAVHVGIATQTDAGLMVPVLRHAENLDLWQTAAELTRLAQAARGAKASKEELSGSTITLSSLGPLGGIATTPILNLPEVAVVAPNRIVERPVVMGGAVVVRKMMNLSSSYDHRVVDGADAAGFVQRLKTLLERPALLFID